jgi:hypothetical protein
VAKRKDPEGEEETPRRSSSAHRSLTPRPSSTSARRKGPPSSEEVQQALVGYDSSLGPKAMREKLAKLGVR